MGSGLVDQIQYSLGIVLLLLITKLEYSLKGKYD